MKNSLRLFSQAILALLSLASIFIFLTVLSLQRKNLFPQSSPSPVPTLFPTPSPSPVSLLVTGDVMLARSLTRKMRQLNDFAYPFTPTAFFLKKADLTLINLESPFGQNCPALDSGMKFCADYRALEGLIQSGVDLVSLANNHALDQGPAGLEFTLQLIKENFMTPIGLRQPAFLKVNNLKFAFLAYNAVNPKNELISWAYPDVVASEIKRFKKEVDLLIVYFHWGQEYAPKPQAGRGSPYDPQTLGHLAIDAGADLVLGTHPHVVQETEWYQGKLIVYSLGNFVFDQLWSEETQKGLIGQFIFDQNGLLSHQLLPVQIINFQPLFKPAP